MPTPVSPVTFTRSWWIIEPDYAVASVYLLCPANTTYDATQLSNIYLTGVSFRRRISHWKKHRDGYFSALVRCEADMDVVVKVESTPHPSFLSPDLGTIGPGTYALDEV